MDTVRSIDTAVVDQPEVEPRMEPPPAIGSDERRMHVRAYNYWVSLLDGRPFPSIDDLDPHTIEDFGSHSVLLDFTSGPDNAAIPFIGKALREEGDHDHSVAHIDDVPGGSLLSRLTDHYLQIIANRAPIGFEAEFVNLRGRNTLYRGILMPFSSTGDTIDFIYGVINWKETIDPAAADVLAQEVAQALKDVSAANPAAAIWADGPNVLADDVDEPDFAYDPQAELPLADRLALARETAEQAAGAQARTRAALYHALGLAYDFALVAEARPDEYAELLDDCGVKPQARAPMTPIVKLVFGVDYDKTRLTEFATALAHGRRLGLPLGGLRPLLEGQRGGLKGVVAAERALRRPAPVERPDPRITLRAAPARAVIDMGAVADEFVLLLARREADGHVAVLSALAAEGRLLDRALRRLGN